MRRTTARLLSAMAIKIFSVPLLLLVGWLYVTRDCGPDKQELARERRDEALLAERRALIKRLASSHAVTVGDFEREFGIAYCGCNPEGPARHLSTQLRFGRWDADDLCGGDCDCLRPYVEPNREGWRNIEGCVVGSGKARHVMKGWFRCSEVPEVIACDARKALQSQAASSYHLRWSLESAKYRYPSMDHQWREAHGFGPEH